MTGPGRDQDQHVDMDVRGVGRARHATTPQIHLCWLAVDALRQGSGAAGYRQQGIGG
eukprot:CAMPEP_0119370626 /NCGR_PEP_ID=MMETSP1334-20130426/16969_1 /TAXON_ID=127549 /ORGANISM="Calcidiscus leptoporus, Strain RCC1130" /LENGTH=56 /DNA_ID=CAMNT_0007387731 /DNA_START=234 /DNA_END=400 /DNA_ORIENTATION=+